MEGRRGGGRDVGREEEREGNGSVGKKRERIREGGEREGGTEGWRRREGRQNKSCSIAVVI